eukprot:266084-Amphidinium_carterae.2
MSPSNAIFKTYRYQAVVQALEDFSDEQIATALVFEGQEQLNATPAGGLRDQQQARQQRVTTRDQPLLRTCRETTCH